MLARYAASDENSRGRSHSEPPPVYRSEFQRDRDRIVHCAAFRRLEYKTQVFVNHEGDLFRTRLTHSLEVAQIARSIARALQLNEDLSEAIALAHDLGHPPFGHAGQDALNDCMKPYGGFEHNLQSLRVVDALEERYAEFSGLNLTFEAREGILKHCSPVKARELGELGRRFIDRCQPSLEAQLVNLADEIAYNHHDVDDGLRSELLSVGALRDVRLFARFHDQVTQRYPTLAPRRTVHETVRRMINHVVTDLIETTHERLAQAAVQTIEDVRRHHQALVDFGAAVSDENLELKRFLRRYLYTHERVRQVTDRAMTIVTELFAAFMRDEQQLPAQYREKIGTGGSVEHRARVIADYIAGMTDRYAYREHRRLELSSASER